MISERSKLEILETAKIEDVIGDFVTLRRRGSNLTGLCPFHPEKTPSFSVSPTKNLYKCFGCGKAGDSVTFLMEHEHLSFPDALRYLAARYGIELEEKQWSPEEQEARRLTESLFLVNDFALKYYQDQLFETDRGKSVGLSYFTQRGFREETIRKFGLGYAPEAYDGFTKEAQQAGYSIEYLQQLGLTTEHKRDFFRGRVMFTIHNQSGKPVGFAGRILGTDKHLPKYVNSPESDIYHKSKVLYGMFFAQRAIRHLDECVLVEGYTDVISLHQAGIENVVASSGTSLTVEQIRLIKRFTPKLTVLYDGDLAGRKAALRGSDLALEQDVNVRVALLPEEDDPDSYLRKVGAEFFREYLAQNAEDFILFKARTLLEEAGHDPLRRTAAAKDVLSSIARIPDSLKRSMYVKECARLFEMEEASLHSELNKQIKQTLQKKLKSPMGAPAPGEAQPGPALSLEEEERLKREGQKPERPPQDNFCELDIARVLIAYGDRVFEEESGQTVAQFVIQNIEDVFDRLENNPFRQIVQMAMDFLKDKIPVKTALFIHHEDVEIQQLAIGLLSSPYDLSEQWAARHEVFTKTPDDNYVKDAINSVYRLKYSILRKVIKQNQEDVKTCQDSEELMKLLQVHQELKEQEKWFAERLGTVAPPGA